MIGATPPQGNGQDLFRRLGEIAKAIGDFPGWLDWITNNKLAWSVVIAISGVASFLVGKGYSAQNCPDLRDFLIGTIAPIAVFFGLVYVIRVKKIRIDYLKKIVSAGAVFLAPVVLTALIYPAVTNWNVTKGWISDQFCPSCMRDISETQRLQTEAEAYSKQGKIQQAEKSLDTAEEPYARRAVEHKCEQAECLLAQVLDAQADVFKKSGKQREGIQKRKEALDFANKGLCPVEFVSRLKVQLTLDAKDAAELKAVNPALPLGASTTLQWFTEGAVRAILDGQPVDLRGEKKISPAQTTDYALQVQFNDGSVKTLSTRVIVYSFSVSPAVVPAGGSSTVTWSAEGASEVTLDQQPVGIRGSKIISYTKTTTHVLRVTFPDKSNADLSSAVRVYSFSATPKYVRPGEPTTISWSAEGANQVMLDGQAVAVQGTRVVTPTQTTLHNLRIVYPDGGSKDVTATINLVPYSFTATPQFIGAGESSRIEWSCPEPSECTLDGQKVTARGYRDVRPAQTTTYTLQIKFPDGSSNELRVTVTVGQGKCDPKAYSDLGYDRVTPTLLQRSIPANISIRIPNVFAQPENPITLTGDEIICLASSPDGKGELMVDDQIDFSVTPRGKTWVHNFYDPVTRGIKTFPSQNVTWMFAPAGNRLKLVLSDTVQGAFYTTDIWLVIWRR